jgi:hypothetical protein
MVLSVLIGPPQNEKKQKNKIIDVCMCVCPVIELLCLHYHFLFFLFSFFFLSLSFFLIHDFGGHTIRLVSGSRCVCVYSSLLFIHGGGQYISTELCCRKKEKKRERAIITVLGLYTGSHQQVIEEIYTV